MQSEKKNLFIVYNLINLWRGVLMIFSFQAFFVLTTLPYTLQDIKDIPYRGVLDIPNSSFCLCNQINVNVVCIYTVCINTNILYHSTK
jgi:hypothetical protein